MAPDPEPSSADATSPRVISRVAASRTSPAAAPTRPLFYSSSPTPKAVVDNTPSLPKVVSPTRRRNATRATARNLPVISRSWTRKLSFSSDQTDANVAPPTPSGTSRIDEPLAHGHERVEPVRKPDVFDLSALEKELDAIAARTKDEVPASRLFASPHRLRPPARRRTSMNDLPDELLLRIFGFLDDQLGYRALPSKVAGSPEWCFPPLRIASVCRRWLPLARYLCYRSLRVSHLARIPALHRGFVANPKLAMHVRHFVVHLPSVQLKDLESVAPIPPMQTPRSGPEPDSDLDPNGQSRPSLDEVDPARSKKTAKLKEKPPMTFAEQLRSIFTSCAFLLSLEVVGIPPSTLFSTSSSSTASSIHRLHQLRLSTIASLTLRASDDAEPLKAMALRDALLGLTGLRCLVLKGYASSLDESQKLNFIPTRTSTGHIARPLPARTRSLRLLPLERLELVECSFTTTDLRALLQQCREGVLQHLVIEDRHTTSRMKRLRSLGSTSAPTVEALPHVVDVVSETLSHLKVSLYNYPLLASTSASSSHILDAVVSQLARLVSLDVGGTVVTPALFAFTPRKTTGPLDNTAPPVSPRLPASIRILTIRACPSLTPEVLLPFLTSLGPLPGRLRQPEGDVSRLSVLTTLGGSEHGWSRPTLTWQVQQACWNAGIRWTSRSSTSGQDDLLGTEMDSPKLWKQGYGPATRTGGAW